MMARPRRHAIKRARPQRTLRRLTLFTVRAAAEQERERRLRVEERRVKGGKNGPLHHARKTIASLGSTFSIDS